ncbi:copper amine oxidase N-terminal domain-containing protein [Peptoniphilus equinus]|uniref:Copper amine oxidase N-terminal domain-containing protein n=1 Tax=Peptoniphilus equinus TaxID=3016343 RepID=A0ABY7QUV2_9FIRM|nr:copper amine oxidase N-terminal domain-containing protein [Peptoniphilus equinus]WBW49958.1 copper amine oxidase N-terminal domain-containing protein [Peptoniphilus equinus]
MKKKLTALLVMMMCVFTLVGCSTNMAAYTAKTQDVAKWAGTKVEGTMEAKVSVKDDNGETIDMTIPYTIKGVSEGQDKVDMNVVVDFTGLKALAKSEAATDEELAMIPDKFDMHMFVDGADIYIAKSYFDLFENLGMNGLKDIEEDYILIKTDDSAAGVDADVVNYLNSSEFEADLLAIIDKALKGYETKLDMVVDGNTFTFEATSDQLIDEGLNSLGTVAKNWPTVVPEIEKVLGKIVPAEAMKELNLATAFDGMNIDDVKKNVEEVKASFTGSKVKFVTTFEDDKYTQEGTFTVKFDNEFAMDLTQNYVMTKDETAKVELPTSVKAMTMNELLGLLMPAMDPAEPVFSVMVNEEPVVFADQQPVLKDNRTLVPFRGMLEALGAEVTWDEAAQKVTAVKDGKEVVLTIGSTEAMVDGKAVSLDVAAEISNGRTLVPLRFVAENLGYDVAFDNTTPGFFLITVATGDKAVEPAAEAPVDAAQPEAAPEAPKAEVTDATPEAPKADATVEAPAEAAQPEVKADATPEEEPSFILSDNPLLKSLHSPEAK